MMATLLVCAGCDAVAANPAGHGEAVAWSRLRDFYAVYSRDKTLAQVARIIALRSDVEGWQLRLDVALLAKYGASPGLHSEQ